VTIFKRRGHLREGRLVRPTIVQTRGPPFDVRLAENRLAGHIAYAPSDSLILLDTAPPRELLGRLTPPQFYRNVLGHESAHRTLDRIGEYNASAKLDRLRDRIIATERARHPERRIVPLQRFVTRSGLPPKRRGVRS
jgi:hypothetical protein